MLLLVLLQLSVLLLWRFIGRPVEQESSEELLCWEEEEGSWLAGRGEWRFMGVAEDSRKPGGGAEDEGVVNR
jgi:hypothetical protein